MLSSCKQILDKDVFDNSSLQALFTSDSIVHLPRSTRLMPETRIVCCTIEYDITNPVSCIPMAILMWAGDEYLNQGLDV